MQPSSATATFTPGRSFTFGAALLFPCGQGTSETRAPVLICTRTSVASHSRTSTSARTTPRPRTGRVHRHPLHFDGRFVQPPHRAAADCWLKRSPTPLNDWKSNSHRDGDLHNDEHFVPGVYRQ